MQKTKRPLTVNEIENAPEGTIIRPVSNPYTVAIKITSGHWNQTRTAWTMTNTDLLGEWELVCYPEDV